MANPYALSLYGGREQTPAEKLGLSLYDTGKTYSNSADLVGPPLATVKEYGLPDYNAGDMSSLASGGTMAAAASGNPYVLAATVGLGYLQQRAADARAKRAKEAEIIQTQASNEANILNNMQNYYGKALLR